MRAENSTRETTAVAIRAQTRAARRDREVAARAARRVQWGRWAVLAVVWQVVAWSVATTFASLVGFTWIKFGFFVVVFSVACLPLFTRVLARPQWLLNRQLGAGDDVALAIGHLPPRLGRLAEETRILRLAIEAAAPDEPAIEEMAWAWVSAVRELGPLEAEVIERLGISHHDVVSVLLGEALAQEEASLANAVTASAVPPDPSLQRRRVVLLAEHLEAFEVALLRYDPDPYRGS